MRTNNKSGFTGVSWYSRHKKWRACIKQYNKQMHLGYFDSKEAASMAYNKAVIELKGEPHGQTISTRID